MTNLSVLDSNLILVFFLMNLPIILFFNQITFRFNIYDKNDNKRKLHTHPISLFGGTIILYNFIICISLGYIFNFSLFDNNFLNDNREVFAFVFGSIFFYLLGLFDDKYVLNSNKKFFFSIIIIYLITSLDESLILNEIKFLNFNKIELFGFSKPFSILCFLLFLNALNMFDGINLQVALYSILLFIIFLLKGINVNFNLIILFSLTLFLYFNYRNRCFLGDSGSNILFFIISCTIIKNYNINTNFQIEEIFILMFLPGLDMFRLFLFRLIKGNNPFKADNSHVHHLLYKIFKNKTFVALILFVVNFLVILIYYFVNFKLIFCIFISIIYFLSIYFIYSKIKFNENL